MRYGIIFQFLFFVRMIIILDSIENLGIIQLHDIKL